MSYRFNPFTGNLDFVGAGVANEEVFTFPNFASFPPTGETGKLYVDGSNGDTYYWNTNSSTYQLTVGKVDTTVTLTQSYDDLGLFADTDLIRDELGNVYERVPPEHVSTINLIEADTNFDYYTIPPGPIMDALLTSTSPEWSSSGNTVTIVGNQGSYDLSVDLYSQNIPSLYGTDTLIVSDRWYVSATGVVNFNPGANTFGFGVGLRSASGAEKYSLLGRISTAADAFLGRAIIAHYQNGNFNVNIADSGVNTIPINNGDTIKVEVRLRDNVFTVTCTNLTEVVTNSVSFTFALNTTAPYFLPNLGSPALWVFGGSFTITEFVYGVEETKRPDTIVLGDSKVRGYNTNSFANRWVNILKSKNPRVIAFSGLANTVTDFLQLFVNDSCTYFSDSSKQPLTAIIALGSNDIRFGLEASLQSNYQLLVDQLESRNIKVYVTELLEEAVNVTSFNAWLSTVYSNTKILPKVQVANTDGIHPDITSNHDIANRYINRAPGILRRRYFTSDVITMVDSSGPVFYHKIDDNLTRKEIFSANQLPVDFFGNYTLEPKTTYVLKGLIHIGDKSIIANDSNTILGLDKSDDGIVYTGTGSAIVSTNTTLTISNIFVSCPLGSFVNFTGREGIDSFQMRECIVGSGSVGTITGGNIIAFNNNICSVNMNGGIIIQGACRNVGIGNNYFANQNAAAIISIPNGTFRTIKVCDNDFRVNNIGIQVSPGVMFSTQGGGQISDNIFSGNATVANRITGVDDDTVMWLLENNTGLVSTSDGYSPNTIKVLTDDFFTGGTETGEIGDLAWQFANGSISTATTAAIGRPGVIRRSSGNTANQVASFFMGRAANAPNFAYDDWVSNIWIFRLVDDLATTIVHAGVSTDWGTLTPTHGVYFEKLGADTTWFAVSRNNGVQTRINTTVPVVLNQYYKFEIIKRGASLVYKIDGVERVTITTNLPDPADLIHFGNTVTSTTNAIRSIDIDYFSGIIKTNNR